jgi:cytochrome P450
MLACDPLDHTRLKRLVSKVFTPRMGAQMRPQIQAIADALLDAVEGRREIDLIDEYAFPLPITVIADLFGVPAADHANFRAWSDTLLSAPPPLTPSEAQMEAAQALLVFMEALFDSRGRDCPGDLAAPPAQPPAARRARGI